jgi:hypothetical protein
MPLVPARQPDPRLSMPLGLPPLHTKPVAKFSTMKSGSSASLPASPCQSPIGSDAKSNAQEVADALDALRCMTGSQTRQGDDKDKVCSLRISLSQAITSSQSTVINRAVYLCTC